MKVEYSDFITRTDLKNNPKKLFLFGDNLIRQGFGGQAKYMRGEPNALGIPTKKMPLAEVKWTRKHPRGYEISSAGDTQFSALYAEIDGTSIEDIYQYDIKKKIGGEEYTSKGIFNPLIPIDTYYKEYLKLWKIWAKRHTKESLGLFDIITKNNYVLTDKFAKGIVSQAHAWADIFNGWIFFSDEEYYENVLAIESSFDQINFDDWEAIVIPSSGLGTGRAQLPERAPDTFKFILSMLEKLKNVV